MVSEHEPPFCSHTRETSAPFSKAERFLRSSKRRGAVLLLALPLGGATVYTGLATPGSVAESLLYGLQALYFFSLVWMVLSIARFRLLRRLCQQLSVWIFLISVIGFRCVVIRGSWQFSTFWKVCLVLKEIAVAALYSLVPLLDAIPQEIGVLTHARAQTHA